MQAEGMISNMCTLHNLQKPAVARNTHRVNCYTTLVDELAAN